MNYHHVCCEMEGKQSLFPFTRLHIAYCEGYGGEHRDSTQCESPAVDSDCV